jgi:small subunit ribosomal protein S9
MAEDEKKDLETSDPTPDEAAGSAEPEGQGEDARAAGPVAEDENAEPAGPAAADASDEEPSTDDTSETASQSDSSPSSEGVPVAEQGEADPSAADAKRSTRTESGDKKDLIPGADLEPIAVEPEERPLSAEEQARREAEEEERRQRDAALVADSDDQEPSAASRAPAKIDGDRRFLATGKRKRSIARVTVLPGSGKFEVNGRPLEEFFPRPLHQTIARQPLTTTGYEGNVDVRVRVHGGGVSGQAGAVRHGIARALTEVDPDLRGELKRRGFLTRDARVKERRKAGLKKARKRPQFSKR